MATQEYLRGGVEKLGEGEVEFIEVTVDLDDEAREQLTTDPHGTVQRFLESRGYVVNAVLIHDPSPQAIARRPVGPHLPACARGLQVDSVAADHHVSTGCESPTRAW